MKTCCREVLWRGVVVLWGIVLEKCCGGVLSGSVVRKCSREVM